MRTTTLVTQLLLIVGGLNWLLVGVMQFDLVAAIFGGSDSILSRIIYTVVGLCAIWQIIKLSSLYEQRPAIGRTPSDRV